MDCLDAYSEKSFTGNLCVLFMTPFEGFFFGVKEGAAIQTCIVRLKVRII